MRLTAALILPQIGKHGAEAYVASVGGAFGRGGIRAARPTAFTFPAFSSMGVGVLGAGVRVTQVRGYSTTQVLCQSQGGRDLSKLPKAKDIVIPMDRVDFKYARSSGPGGQNVNKVNSKAEIRFEVQAATWLPEDVRARLANYQANKMNNDGELIVVSQEFRTQSANKDACIGKLQEMVAEAYLKPKERKMWQGIGEKGKKIRREAKSRRSETKQNRRASKNVKDW